MPVAARARATVATRDRRINGADTSSSDGEQRGEASGPALSNPELRCFQAIFASKSNRPRSGAMLKYGVQMCFSQAASAGGKFSIASFRSGVRCLASLVWFALYKINRANCNEPPVADARRAAYGFTRSRRHQFHVRFRRRRKLEK
jgi:hypothetical protein